MFVGKTKRSAITRTAVTVLERTQFGSLKDMKSSLSPEGITGAMVSTTLGLYLRHGVHRILKHSGDYKNLSTRKCEDGSFYHRQQGKA